MDTYVITAFVEETPQGYAFAHRRYPIGQRFQDLSLVFRLLNGVGSDVQYGLLPRKVQYKKRCKIIASSTV